MKIFSAFSLVFSFIFLSSTMRGQAGEATPANMQNRFSGSSENLSVQQNLATGELNIQVQIIEIEDRFLKIPVSLNYQTGGIKASQTAGSFGLGWTLGGALKITRQLNGEIDEKTNGWLSTNSGIESFTTGNDDLVSTWGMQKKDVQPDIFYYQLLNESGSFCFDSQDNIKFLNETSCKVTHSVLNDDIISFEIIDGLGNKYLFAQKEYSSTGSGCNLPSNTSYVSDWHISEIRNQYDQQEFGFTYEVNSLPVEYYYVSESRTIGEPIPWGDVEACTMNTNFECQITYSKYETRLSSIYSSYQKVRFHYSSTARTDLPNSKSISSITVENIEAEAVLTFEFLMSYFEGTQLSNKRLRLDAINLINSSNESMPYKSFSYESMLLPSILTKDIDHWGYCNSLTPINSTRVPSYSNGTISFSGGNRNVHPEHCKIGMLKSITDQHGAVTSYAFESNTYSKTPSGLVDLSNNTTFLAGADWVLSPAFGWDAYEDVANFSISNSERLLVNYSIVQDPLCDEPSFVKITDQNNVEVFYRDEVPSEWLSSAIIELPAGTYNIVCSRGSGCLDGQGNPTVGIGFSALFVKKILFSDPSEKIAFGGGLRIKSITTVPGNNLPASQTNFIYQLEDDDQRSSGVLVRNFDYSYYTYEINEYYGGVECEFLYSAGCDKVNIMSSSATLSAGDHGNKIHYSNVKTYSSASPGNSGYTIMKFTAEISDEGIAYPFPYQDSRFLMNGTNTEIAIYDGTDHLLKREVFAYETVIEPITNASKYAHEKTKYTFCMPALGAWVPGITSVLFKRANYTLEKVCTRLMHKQTDYYSGVLMNSVSQDFVYSTFDNIASETITTTSDPLKPLMVQRTKFVADYILSGNGDVMTSALNYILNSTNHSRILPIETITLVGNSLSSLNVTEGTINGLRMYNGKPVVDGTYKLELATPIADNSFVPAHISGTQFSKHTSYRKIAQIIEYNEYFQPIASQQENDICLSVFLDESNNKIAEVSNATPEKCAYTSFESVFQNGWQYDSDGVTELAGSVMGINFAHGKTGSKFYELSEGEIVRPISPGIYVLSFWINAGTPEPTITWPQVMSTELVDGPDGESWTYYEYRISNPTNATINLEISGSSWIDELRIYPFDATMKTTCYNTDGSIRSVCNVNNQVKTYLYDGWNRLEWTLGDNWQITDYVEYHVKDANDSQDHSWTKNRTVMAEGLSESDVRHASYSNEDVLTTITYYDGLKRPIQSLAVKQSPSHRDLVIYHEYDEFGRESIKYLPFTSSLSNLGNYIENASTAVLDFYDGTSNVVETEYPFAVTEYEKSPLNRPLRSGNVGAEWQLSTDHSVNTTYLLNVANEVLLWRNNVTNVSAMVGSTPQFYPANSLFKKEIEDEHGTKMWEFTNTSGQLVCKRVRVWAAGNATNPYTYSLADGEKGIVEPDRGDASYRNYDTYFIYDDFGRLCFEMPAIVTFSCGNNFLIEFTSGGQHYKVFDGYMTAYKYDQRGRQIESKKPGEGWSEYVYNKLGQVILSKTPELSSNDQKWNYVKYDLLGRPIQTGFYNTNLSRSAMQLSCDGSMINAWETKNGPPSAPYSNSSFPITGQNDLILSETYYDTYDFDINGYSYDLQIVPPLSQSNRTKGLVTGTKVLVMDDNLDNYLTSVSYYDRDGRLAVEYSENILGGFDKIIKEYNYSGGVERTQRLFIKDGVSDELVIESTFEYDHANRPIRLYSKIGNDEEITLYKLIYNELGQVVKKHLHITDDVNTGMQVIDYRYNERGWLTKINNANLVDDGDNLEYWDVFGEELIYHEENRYYSTVMDMQRQFNGNIAAIKWKTNRRPELNGASLGGHSYVFRYDKLRQLTGAFYASSANTYIDNYSYKTHFWDEKQTYDSNGNIRSLTRKRGTNDHGNPLTSALTVDNLSYTYNDYSNKVLTIQDSGQDNWIVSEFYSHFIDNNAGGAEYTYDTEGRVETDQNKGLSFEYNHMDLITQASIGTENVEFIWDASGQKLAKIVGSSTVHYFNGIEYQNNILSCVSTSEGIARTTDGNIAGTNWVYDYYLKDHLGSVRAVITEENSEIITERVTVELNKRQQEEEQFENVGETEYDKPYMYPYDPIDPSSQKVTELTTLSGKVIGPSKVLAVSEGEKIDLSVGYWYTEVPGDPLESVAEILAGTLLNLGSASAGIIESGPEAGMALINNVNGPQFSTLNSFIDDQFDDVDFSNPQAYIVYMYFDYKMMLVTEKSGIIQVSEANTLGQLSKSDIIAETNGFFYTYVTNRSEGKVYFDNLTIKRWSPKVRRVYDYYPYGLAWENPKISPDQNAVHDRQSQDKEFQFSEFSSGKGLALYDFAARMYDPAMARWMVPDPESQFANPYLAMANNPVLCVDNNGKWATLPPSFIVYLVENFQMLQMLYFIANEGYVVDVAEFANAYNQISIQTESFLAGNNMNFTITVKNLIDADYIQFVQILTGTPVNEAGMAILAELEWDKFFDENKMVKTAYKTEIDGEMVYMEADGAYNSFAHLTGVTQGGNRSQPYYLNLRIVPKEMRLDENGNGSASTADSPSMADYMETLNFLTIVVAGNYMDSGKDMVISAFEWGFHDYGVLNSEDVIFLNNPWMSQDVMNTIHQYYPNYNFFGQGQ